MVTLSHQRKYLKHAYRYLILLCTLVCTHLHAHPHSWIDLKTEVVGNETHIQGFKMSWTFDAMTSVYMLDGEDLSPENKTKTFKDMAAYLMKNIDTEHYFTYFYTDDQIIKNGFSDQGVVTQNNLQITLEFYLPLLTPQEMGNNTMKLFVYEAGYYTDMSWENANDIQLSTELSKHCSLTLIQPNPTEEQFVYAASLAADENPNYEQGKVFSQSAEIICNH